MVFKVDEIPKEVRVIFNHNIEKIQDETNIKRLERFKIYSSPREINNYDTDSMRFIKNDKTQIIADKVRFSFPKISRLNQEMINYWRAFIEKKISKEDYFREMGISYDTATEGGIVNKHLEQVDRIMLGIFMDDLNFKLLFKADYSDEVKTVNELLEWLENGDDRGATMHEQHELAHLIKENINRKEDKYKSHFVTNYQNKISKYLANFKDMKDQTELREQVLMTILLLTAVTNQTTFTMKTMEEVIETLFTDNVERKDIFTTGNIMKALSKHEGKNINHNNNYKNNYYKDEGNYDKRDNQYQKDKSKDSYKGYDNRRGFYGGYSNKNGYNPGKSRFEGSTSTSNKETSKIDETKDSSNTNKGKEKEERTYAIQSDNEEEGEPPKKLPKYEGDNK